MQVSGRCMQVVLDNLAEASFSTSKIWSLLLLGVLVPLAILMPVMLNGCAGVANKTSVFSVSGTISPATGGSGTTLTLGAAATAAATADSTWCYTFSRLAT